MNAKKKDEKTLEFYFLFFKPDSNTSGPLRLYQNPVTAGFPSPAEDYAEKNSTSINTSSAILLPLFS